jgi:hypothetical protein
MASGHQGIGRSAPGHAGRCACPTGLCRILPDLCRCRSRASQIMQSVHTRPSTVRTEGAGLAANIWGGCGGMQCTSRRGHKHAIRLGRHVACASGLPRYRPSRSTKQRAARENQQPAVHICQVGMQKAGSRWVCSQKKRTGGLAGQRECCPHLQRSGRRGQRESSGSAANQVPASWQSAPGAAPGKWWRESTCRAQRGMHAGVLFMQVQKHAPPPPLVFLWPGMAFLLHRHPAHTALQLLSRGT